MDIAPVACCMDSVLEAANCFGVPAVLNYEDKQLDVCSSGKTALSSQHSTDRHETTAPVAWA